MMLAIAFDTSVSCERPEPGDDDLLGPVCQLGRDVSAAAMRETLSARAGAEISRVEEKIERLHSAGLVRFVYGSRRRDHCHRLTAVGVDRLPGLQREPVPPVIS